MAPSIRVCKIAGFGVLLCCRGLIWATWTAALGENAGGAAFSSETGQFGITRVVCMFCKLPGRQ